MSDTQHHDLAAIIRLSPEFLAQILQLPEGCYVDAVWSSADRAVGELLLRVRGAGWPVHPGLVIPWCFGTVTQQLHADGTRLRDLIRWDFPEPEEAPATS